VRLTSAICSAWRSLVRHKGRSILTSLGIIIGIGTVISLVAAGDGVQTKLDQQLSAVGKNMILIRAGARLKNGAIADPTPLTQDDVTAIRRGLGSRLVGVAEVQLAQRQTASKSATRTSLLCGTTADLPVVRDWQLACGRFFTREESTHGANVCVLGETVRKELFPDDPCPLGKVVRVDALHLRVVGVFTLKGRTPTGADQDDEMFLPLVALQRKVVGGSNKINIILTSVASKETIDPVVEEITQVLRRTHHSKQGQEDFDVTSVQEMATLGNIIMGTIKALVAVIASLSLLVGGIGIMNIMLVSVTERTKEIGLRMAVGARPSDVMRQFLIEAVILSLMGGTIGIGLGIAGAVGLAWLAEWPAVISPGVVLLAAGVSAGVGVFFGFYPAWRASRLDPIEALRYE
jgi:putative ABC transport system permease protein